MRKRERSEKFAIIIKWEVREMPRASDDVILMLFAEFLKVVKASSRKSSFIIRAEIILPSSASYPFVDGTYYTFALRLIYPKDIIPFA
jgi:hypothetical protein